MLSCQACYLCQRCSLPPTTQGGVPALLLAGVLAPSRATQWGLIYEPRSSGRYLPALFTIQFSIQLGSFDPVRYRGHAPRMDYLALTFQKRLAN